MQIVVIGSGKELSAKIEKLAEEVGKEITKAGAVLVCGGMAGVMEAACKGAKSAGGKTVGILPSSDSETANKYLDVKVPTSLGFGRNFIVSQCGDAVIIINGAFGTLSEVAFAVGFGKKMIVLEDSGGVASFIKELEKIPEIKKELEQFNSKIVYAKSAKEAVELATKE